MQGPRDYTVHPRPSRWRSLAQRGGGTTSLHLPREAAKGTSLMVWFAIGGQLMRSTLCLNLIPGYLAQASRYVRCWTQPSFVNIMT